MAVTLVSTPDPFALTKGGRMLYQFSGSGRYATTGVRAESVLFLVDDVEHDTRLLLRWHGKTYTLLFVANPIATNEFSIGNGSSAYVDNLLTELNSYYPIREAFTLTRLDSNNLPGIVFLAKQPGPAYDITVTLPPNTPFGINRTAFGADPLLRVQYSIYVELWLQTVGTPGTNLATDYERIFQAPAETDAAGLAEFDAGSILHAHLTADWPSWILHNPLSAQTSQRKYFLCYGEAYGSPLEIARIVTDEVRWAYLGGGDYRHRAGGGWSFLSGRNSHAEDDAALRFGPLDRYVRVDEPQYLTFLNSRADQTGALVKIVRTYDNGDTNTRIELLSAQAFPAGQKLTFAVGPTQQDLINTLPAGRTLREYTVQLVNTDEVALSVVYRYLLNYDYQPYTRYFAYLNSLGAVETLATFGKGSRELARFTEQAERYLPANYELADGQFIDYNISLQQQVEVTTGFRSEAELKGWSDFYRSPQRFRLVDGQALPIGIVAKSIKQSKDGDTLFAHKFDYTYLFRDDFYTGDTGEVGLSIPPPPGFAPAGSVTIEQPTVIRSIDDTVPNAVRGLTQNVIASFNQAVAWGNHALAGYLTQSSGSILFRRKDQKVPYTELVNTPTTRDQAGLTDVPTRRDLFKLIHITSHLSSWTGTEIPEEL